MTGVRRYDDACAVALALDIVGERWSLLVVRELILGPKRFSDLRVALPGISADVLTQRLRSLGAQDVVRRRRLPPPAASDVYELTTWGAELDDVVMALGRWSSRSEELVRRRHHPISVDSVMLSLRVRFDPEAAAGLRTRLVLLVDDIPFELTVDDRTLRVTRSAGPSGVEPSVRLTSTTLLELSSGRSTLDDELAAGRVELVGDEGAVFRRLLTTLVPD